MIGTQHVATHQKTQQGLKQAPDQWRYGPGACRNASENPAGIETQVLKHIHFNINIVATHQKTQQGLKPAEGLRGRGLAFVATHQKTQQGLKLQQKHQRTTSIRRSQRIRKPSRD